MPDEEKPQGIWGTLRAKVFSFGMVLAVAFLLLVSTILTTALSTILDQLSLGPAWLYGIINFLLNLAIISFVFMLLFKYLPSTQVEWRDVAIGGVLTGILWVVGQFVLSYYFANSSFTSYGVIGGVLAFLVYVYYSSQIVFLGGEFTQSTLVRTAAARKTPCATEESHLRARSWCRPRWQAQASANSKNCLIRNKSWQPPVPSNMPQPQQVA